MEVKPRRDAQIVASIFNSAQEAGAKALKQVKNVDAAIEKLAKGVEGNGHNADAKFSFPLSSEDGAAAKVFLRMEGEHLVLSDFDAE
ncbi:MAG: hypothetical protein ACI9DF_002151 [Verrucomicrobiales bacterium]